MICVVVGDPCPAKTRLFAFVTLLLHKGETGCVFGRSFKRPAGVTRPTACFPCELQKPQAGMLRVVGAGVIMSDVAGVVRGPENDPRLTDEELLTRRKAVRLLQPTTHCLCSEYSCPAAVTGRLMSEAHRKSAQRAGRRMTATTISHFHNLPRDLKIRTSMGGQRRMGSTSCE